MGAGSSREENPMSAREASSIKEELEAPEEATKLDKTLQLTGKSVAEPKKLEEQEEPMEVIKKKMEGKKSFKEELEKPKEAIGKSAGEARKVPHKYEAIMKEAGEAATGSPDDQIHYGIYLNNKKQMYWVEESSGYNCFMVFARGLLITWSQDQRYWHWHYIKETSDVEIEVASLLNVCWLEVHGRFETSYLTPGVMYEVVFVVMMDSGYGWDIPINLRLILVDSSTQEHKECLHEKPRGQWIELKAGDFMAHPGQVGEIEFSMFEYEGGQWKRGIVVKGAIIRPKK